MLLLLKEHSVASNDHFIWNRYQILKIKRWRALTATKDIEVSSVVKKM